MKVARRTISKALWVVGLCMLVGLGGANGAFSVLGMPYSGVETFDGREFARFQHAIVSAPTKGVEMTTLAYSQQLAPGGKYWISLRRVKYRVWVDRGYEFPYGNPIPYAQYLWQLLIVGGVIFGISFRVKPKAKSQL